MADKVDKEFLEFIDSLGRFERDIKKEFPDDAIIKALNLLADALAKEIEKKQGSPEPKTGRATGGLQQSILEGVNRKLAQRGVKYTLESSNVLNFYNDGSKPHRPPYEPIFKWVQHKGLNTELTRHLKINRRKTTEQIQRGIAWAVVKSIEQKGTIQRFNYRGSNFFTNIVTKDRDKLIENLFLAIREEYGDRVLKIVDFDRRFNK